MAENRFRYSNVSEFFPLVEKKNKDYICPRCKWRVRYIFIDWRIENLNCMPV